MANSQVQITVGVDATGVQQGLNAAAQAAGQVGNQATKATQRAAAATATWQQGLQRLRAQARLFGADLIGRLTAAYGAMALFDKMVNATTESFKRMGEISKASRKAGLSAEDYQRVSRVAEDMGASVDEAAEAAGRYARMIRDAAAGNEEARQSLLALGYTDAQVRRGNISTIDVLARLSAQYRAARTEAERLRIEKESGVSRPILEAGPAAIAMAGSARVTSQAEADRRAAEQEATGRTEGLFSRIGAGLYDIFLSEAGKRTANITGVQMSQAELADNPLFAAAAGTAPSIAPGMDAHGIRALQAQLANTNLTEEERGNLEAKLRTAFAEFADDFRVAFTGTTQGGVVQTRDMIEQELQRKFEKMFPQYATPTGGLPIGGPAAAGPQVAQGVSSLQAIGGGGGFFDGSSDMVSIATRTADAAERTAELLEVIAKNPGSISQPASPVSAD